jgi:hypothetical protein
VKKVGKALVREIHDELEEGDIQHVTDFQISHGRKE